NSPVRIIIDIHGTDYNVACCYNPLPTHLYNKTYFNVGPKMPPFVFETSQDRGLPPAITHIPGIVYSRTTSLKQTPSHPFIPHVFVSLSLLFSPVKPMTVHSTIQYSLL
ncbi:hypothetical protein L9F63_009751, partial [Diploptera punctata]